MVYKNVHMLAIANGESIRQVESACGIGNGTISKWKDGKRVPSLITLTKLAEHFNVPVAHLITECELKPKND